jgi:hypothetical protein
VDPRRLPLQYQVLKGYEYGIAGGELTAALTRDGSSRFRSPDGRESRIGDGIAAISIFITFPAKHAGSNAYSSGKSLIYLNQEFRSDHLGHVCLLNLKQLIEPVMIQQPEAYPLHAQVCDRVHAQGGYVSWAHFPSMPALESRLDELFSSLYGTRRPENVFAHTPPVYATVDGRPVRSWDDAQYYVVFHRSLRTCQSRVPTAGARRQVTVAGRSA